MQILTKCGSLGDAGCRVCGVNTNDVEQIGGQLFGPPERRAGASHDDVGACQAAETAELAATGTCKQQDKHVLA